MRWRPGWRDAARLARPAGGGAGGRRGALRAWGGRNVSGRGSVAQRRCRRRPRLPASSGYRAWPIAVGRNTNLRVDTVAGPLFLRINEGKSEDDVRREGGSWRAAARRTTPAPPTPRGCCSPLGRGIVSLFPGSRATLARAELTPVHAAAVGTAWRTAPRERRLRIAPGPLKPARSTGASRASRRWAVRSGRPSRAGTGLARSPEARRPCPRGSFTAICSSTTCCTTTRHADRAHRLRAGLMGPPRTTLPSHAGVSATAATISAHRARARRGYAAARPGEERAAFGAGSASPPAASPSPITDVHLSPRRPGAGPSSPPHTRHPWSSRPGVGSATRPPRR